MRKILLLSVLALISITPSRAQDIQVTKFERNVTSLIASMDPVYDISGEACAVIRFYVREDGFEIEPNLGVLKREDRTGEIRMWVPMGTKRLTIRHAGSMPLTGYEIPVVLEPKVTYDATVELVEKAQTFSLGSDVHFFIGAGYNVMSISGPSLAIGLDISHHIIELDGVLGLNKTDDWYFYNNSGNAIAAYNYKAIRLALRYGYDFKASDAFSIIPQIGVAYNSMSGEAVGTIVQNGTYKSASSISALAAVRLAVALGENFRLHVTPEYDLGLSKDNVCKLVSDNDSKSKSWTDGFNLNIGLMVYF